MRRRSNAQQLTQKCWYLWKCLIFLQPSLDHTWALKKRKRLIFLFLCFIPSAVISKCGTLIMLIFRTVSSFDKEMWTLKLTQPGIPLPGQLHSQWKWVLFCLQIKNKKVVSSIIPRVLFTLIYQLLPRNYRVQEHYSTVRTHPGLSYWKNYSWH